MLKNIAPYDEIAINGGIHVVVFKNMFQKIICHGSQRFLRCSKWLREHMCFAIGHNTKCTHSRLIARVRFIIENIFVL